MGLGLGFGKKVGVGVGIRVRLVAKMSIFELYFFTVLVGAGLSVADRLLVDVLRLPYAPRPRRRLLPPLEKREKVKLDFLILLLMLLFVHKKHISFQLRSLAAIVKYKNVIKKLFLSIPLPWHCYTF